MMVVHQFLASMTTDPNAHAVTHAIRAIALWESNEGISLVQSEHCVCVCAHSCCCANEIPLSDLRYGTLCTCVPMCKGPLSHRLPLATQHISTSCAACLQMSMCSQLRNMVRFLHQNEHIPRRHKKYTKTPFATWYKKGSKRNEENNCLAF